jgi:outer membrane protein assembly factor BamD
LFRHFSGRTTTLLVLAVVLALSGCGILKKKKPELVYKEEPVEVLYNAGSLRLDHHQWSEAVDYFREVERQHPYSEWSRRAILMTAYAHYQANNYAEALADSDRFIALYPGNASAAYAYYLKAICYFEQIVDVGRDQASAAAAGEALREVAKRFPTTEYASDARLKLDMVQDQLAGKEMNVGRFYLRSGNPVAAIGRFRTVVDKYQTTTHTPEALYRLVESYLTVGLVHEAKENAAVLGYNYPGDPWYSDAYKLMTTRGFRPSQAPQPGGRRGLHLPFFGRHKETTLPPPAAEPPTEATDETETQSEPKSQAPAKQGGLVHGVLGL